MVYPAVPKKLEEKLGEEETRLLVEWLEEFLREKGVTKDEYREILSRLDILENTVEGLKSEFKEFKRETNERFALVHSDINELRGEINDLRKEMNERFDKINERFDAWNERFDKMNERFDKVNERFDKMNERFDQIYERMTSLIKWTIGTLALFGTLITIILTIGQFVR